jgi:hypothetical protein
MLFTDFYKSSKGNMKISGMSTDGVSLRTVHRQRGHQTVAFPSPNPPLRKQRGQSSGEMEESWRQGGRDEGVSPRL